MVNHHAHLMASLSLLGLIGMSSALPYPEDQVSDTIHYPGIGFAGVQPTRRDISVTTYSRRGDTSGRCVDLSLDEAKRLPGWSKLEKYAKDTWGDGSWNIVTNPEDYPDRWATSCVDSQPTTIKPAGAPKCNVHDADAQINSKNATGDFISKIQVGDKTTGSWTVTQTSEIGISASFEVGFEVPDLFEAKASFSTETKFSNSRGSTFTTEHNSMTEFDSSIDNPKDTHCTSKLKVKDCTQKGSGKIRVVATGFVWFNYDSATAPKKDPKGDKHYKWAAHIDEVLSLDERSGWMEFDGVMNGRSQAVADKECKGLENKAKKNPKKPAPKDPKKPAPKDPKKPVHKAPPKDPKHPAKPAPPKHDPHKPAPKPTEKKPTKPEHPAEPKHAPAGPKKNTKKGGKK